MNLLSREDFRAAVFNRDSHKCIVCKSPAADAHHIIERRLWCDGGYYLENGVSLCPIHHIEAEQTVLTCEKLRNMAGITVIALPAHFDREERYDKWGNVFLLNGLRVKGELYYDESVLSILRQGKVLDEFTEYVKFPKIYHLPWSDSIDERTDRVFTLDEIMVNFQGKEIVVTEKLDGENTSMYNSYIHARSLNSPNHSSRNWVKNLHSTISHEIPEGWRICGENVYALHSIPYEKLTSYFYVFAIYNEQNICLTWDETVDYANILNLATVPLLYKGLYDEGKVKQCFTNKSAFTGSDQEGYVMRLASTILWSQHKNGFAKFVRKNHVTTSHNWMHKTVIPNKLTKNKS